jgi:hypothetical protein
VTIDGGSAAGVNFAVQTWTISGKAGIGGATVTLSGTSSGTVTVDSSGNYGFANLMNGNYTVTPTKSGYAFSPTSQPVTISEGNATANFTATPVLTYSISGTISPAANGSGTTVTLSGAASETTTADPSGNYTFSGLANGSSYTVTPTKSGFTFSPTSQPVTISGADATANFTAQSAPITVDVTTSKDQGTASNTVATSTFSTKSANELLLAFISTDGPSSGTNTTVSSVAGAGLTWVLVKRTNTQSGTSEIWRTFATSALTNVSVTATLSQSFNSSMTVMSFTGVDISGTNGSGAIGATGTGNANPGAPGATLVTTRNNSWVFGVGNDWDNAIARSPGTNQTIVHQSLAPVGDTYWVQTLNSSTLVSGTTVTVTDTAPTNDRYNLSICEILPALGSSPPAYTISGTISPAIAGSGAVVALSGTAAATTTADGTGTYSFNGLPNGTYTVTPSSLTAAFSPASQTVTVNGADSPSVNFTASSTSTVIFYDDFTGTALSPNWTVISRHGEYAQNETECNIPHQVSVANGFLTITTAAQSATCGDFNIDGSARHSPSSWPYITGDIQWTNLNFTYGTVEIRARFPAKGTGLWPALWLLGANCQTTNIYTADVGYSTCPTLSQSSYAEVDMVECDLNNWCQLALSNTNSFPTCGWPVDTNLHVFTLIWTASAITTFMDGQPTGCSFKSGTWTIPSTPMFLLIQTQTGGAGGAPNNSLLPADFAVDYVKVTQP